MYLAAEKSLPKRQFRHYLKPYWNEAVKTAHKFVLYERKMWIENGRLRGRQFQTYCDYTDAKTNFRKIHEQAYTQYMELANKELDKAAEIDMRLFWKLFRGRKRTKKQLTTEIIYNNETAN